MKNLFFLFKKTFQEWGQDNASVLAAALAYYTVFSLVPLILLVIFLLGFFLNDQVIQEQILTFFQSNVGADTAQTIQSMIKAFDQQKGSLFAKIIGFIMLALGATGVVNQLQFAFNKIWNVELRPDAGIKIAFKKRILSFAIIGLVGLLVLTSLLLSMGLALALNFLNDLFPTINYLLPLSELLISFGILSLLFMLMFRYLPDVKLSWRHVWRGAFLTGFLFLIGKFALSWYFSAGNITSTYGAASSFIILLLWIYYSSLILLFGVEFTQVWSKEKGLVTKPQKSARFQAEKIIIHTPGLAQKISTILAVLKAELKLVRFALKVKRFFTKKKTKK